MRSSSQVVRIASARFTDAIVRKLSLPHGKTDHIEWDPELPGFGVRLRPGNSFYVVQYRIGNKQRRVSLGDVRKTGLDLARESAKIKFAQVVLGIDPAAEKEKLRASQKAAALTFKALAEKYLAARKEKQRASTHAAVKRYLIEKHCLPLHRKPVDRIDINTVDGLIVDIERNNGRTAAARARANLSAAFAWGMRKGFCTGNPVLGTEDPEEGIDPRDRVLESAELKAIWRQCRDDDFGRIVRLLLLTACRRDEIGCLRWSEINLETGKLLLPKDRTKSGRALEMTLPATARAILASVPRRVGRDALFGGGRQGFNAWSYSTLSLNARITDAAGRALPPYRLHDLRRTVRTGMAKIGIKPHIAELVLNHTGHKGGIGGVYDHYDYQPEIAEALTEWEKHLLAIVEQ
jgi:integrase